MEYQAIDPIHAHMAIYRAIENGVTLVRQADNGLSIAVDPYGRVSATLDHFNNNERVFVAKVPILSAFTIDLHLHRRPVRLVGDGWLGSAGDYRDCARTQGKADSCYGT